MKLIPTEFKKAGWTHEQLRREGNVAIYRRHKEPTRPHYEVIKVMQNAAHEIAGISFPESESYPTDKQWGKNGFTYQSIETAEQKFNALCKL